MNYVSSLVKLFGDTWRWKVKYYKDMKFHEYEGVCATNEEATAVLAKHLADFFA